MPSVHIGKYLGFRAELDFLVLVMKKLKVVTYYFCDLLLITASVFKYDYNC